MTFSVAGSNGWQGATAFATTASRIQTDVPTAGNLLVAVVGWSDDASFTSITDDINDGGTWTLVDSTVDNGYRNVRMYWKIVGTPSGGGKTVTLTISGAAGCGVAWAEYTAGSSMPYAIDGTPVKATTQVGTNPSIGTVTTTSAAGLIVGVTVNSAIDYTAGSGYTERYGTTGMGYVSVIDKFTTAAGGYTADWTGASTTWSGIVAAFTADASGVTGPLIGATHLMNGGILMKGRLI